MRRSFSEGMAFLSLGQNSVPLSPIAWHKSRREKEAPSPIRAGGRKRGDFEKD
jgi:hypothetical protein